MISCDGKSILNGVTQDPLGEKRHKNFNASHNLITSDVSASACIGNADASQSAASADVNSSASSSASNTRMDVCVSFLS